jgi:biopolymer transport protein ExbB
LRDSLYESFLYLQQGGWVMVPLILSSLVMWALILERFYRFRLMTNHDIPVEDAIKAVQGAPVSIAGEGLRARLVSSFLLARTGLPDLDRDILRQSSLRLRPEPRRFLALIAVLASVAPLLGLLGTVLGMIETFDVIAIFGTGNAKAMAGGISVALVTTQTGLLIAIPGLFISGMLNRHANRLTVHLDEITTMLDRIVKRSAQPKGGKE